MKAKIVILFLFGAICLSAQINGPSTDQIDLDKYSQVFFVSVNGSDQMNNGTEENPFKTIQYALSKVNNTSESTTAVIIVSEGVYGGGTIILKPYADLYGGFNENNWERDVILYTSEISTEKGQRAIVTAQNNIIDGFTISGAEYQGKGAAIYCEGTSPRITNNKFIANKTLKPHDWNPKYWHETANDGGAIYGTNGASPFIKNNHFIHNKTENGRGAAIAFDGNCDPVVENNLFYQNLTGIDDPMRSSDGGAVSLFRWCKGIIKNNLFLNNFAGSNNDGGAVFIALWSSTKVENNIFVGNECDDDAGALFVGGQEHRYDSPLDLFPPKDKFFVSIKENIFVGNRNPSMNSGAMRFTMESRGEFINNIVAHNNGIYFQRSETDIINNVILDNMLVVETKEYLKKTNIKNNVIWSDFYLSETIANIENNYMLEPPADGKNQNIFPGFVQDGFKVGVYSAYYLKAKGYTELIIDIPDQYDEDLFVNRIVNKDSNWGVVRSYDNYIVQVWGNFSAVTSINVLPTYTLKK